MSITGIDTNAFIGAEFIQKAAFYRLYDNLNAVQLAVQNAMTIYDEEFNTRTGNTLDPLILEPILPENFHEGHRPSLIKAAIEKYPNCSVTMSRAIPAPGSAQLDQMDAYAETLAVEVMVKSIDSEREVDLRCKRLVEAVNLTFDQDRTLDGAISVIDQPSVIFGDVFTRSEKTSYGPEWFWQGARLEYPVRKNTPSAVAQGGFFADFDQAP